MKLFVCLDEAGGMTFNNRRQSSDRVIRQNMLETIGTYNLYINSYTAKQFTEESSQLIVDDNFLETAQTGDYVFVENKQVQPYLSNIEQIIVYRWQRAYPADCFFDIDLTEKDWTLSSTEEFAGYSHECILKETYMRNQ